MNCCRPHIIFLVTALLAACSSHSAEQAEVAGYDSVENCLNGTMIVSRDGRYGLADTSGREILPPDYDEIYFLTDDLAAAFNGGVCAYFDKSGRRLGETPADPEVPEDELLARFSRLEKARREQWDGILDLYESLRAYCLSDSASVERASLMAEEVKAAARKVGGPMEKDQKARFESDCSTYRH